MPRGVAKKLKNRIKYRIHLSVHVFKTCLVSGGGIIGHKVFELDFFFYYFIFLIEV